MKRKTIHNKAHTTVTEKKRREQSRQVFDLFIAGSSVFPTVGYANPTLTIVALAVRLAEYLKQRLANPV